MDPTLYVTTASRRAILRFSVSAAADFSVTIQQFLPASSNIMWIPKLIVFLKLVLELSVSTGIPFSMTCISSIVGERHFTLP